MKRLNRSFLFAAAASSLATGVVFGQFAVPWGECDSQCPYSVWPQDVDPCCSPSLLTATCTRTDSPPIVVVPGVYTKYPPPNGIEIVCENCCKFKPNDCPGNDINPDPRQCSGTTGISFTESISKNVSGAITFAKGAVELSLEAGIGVTSGSEVTLTITCPLSTPKCKSSASFSYIRYLKGRKVKINHTWSASGAWISYYCTCPIAGNTWNVPASACNSATSTAIGDVIVGLVCGSPFEKPCPEQSPCN